MNNFDVNVLAGWGSLLSGLGTLVLALVGSALIAYDVRLRRQQLSETRSRAYAALNVDLQVSIHRKAARGSGIFEWVVESRVTVTNMSTQIFAIPAVYIQARALAEEDEQSHGIRLFSESDFQLLPLAGQLSLPKNVARFPMAIWHMGPGEVDSVVRWDVLSQDFIEHHPALIVRAEVFSVPDVVIRAATVPGNEFLARREWMEFMESDGGVRHEKVIFAPSVREIAGIKPGSWILLEAGSNEIDGAASIRFRAFLNNLSKTGRQHLAVLESGGEGEEPEAKKPRKRQTGSHAARGQSADT